MSTYEQNKRWRAKHPDKYREAQRLLMRKRRLAANPPLVATPPPPPPAEPEAVLPVEPEPTGGTA